MADSEALKACGLQGRPERRMASLSSIDMDLHITPIMNKATGNHVQLPAWAMMFFFLNIMWSSRQPSQSKRQKTKLHSSSQV